MDLNELIVFAQVVRAGSFTAASRSLGIPKSTVSRKVSDLEDRLDTRLLQRTTRKLSLTDAGRLFYDHCARIAAEVESAHLAVTSLKTTPRGLLRVTSGPNASYLGPIICDYLKRYPEVRLELVTTTRAVDLVEERFDVGIRAGRLPDSSLIAKSLGVAGWFLVASPAYLKRRGRPRAPADLAKHEIVHFLGSERVTLHLERGDDKQDVEVSPRLVVSELDLLRPAVVGGLGIALLPAFQCVDDLRARRLERVLREWEAPPTPIHLVYPSTRHVSPTVKSFIEHVQEHMTPPPWQI